MDTVVRKTRRTETRICRIQWSNHTEAEATWEIEDDLRKEFPYLFEELSASTLQPDGVRYPGRAYPKAVAVSASGLLATATGSAGEMSNLALFHLGVPAATFTATCNLEVRPHGLALSAT